MFAFNSQFEQIMISGKGGYASGSVAVARNAPGGYRTGEGKGAPGSRRKKTSASGVFVGAREEGAGEAAPGRKRGGGKGKSGGGNATAAFVRKKKK
ncbi:hypothetical protein [Paenibacillus macerans]|uniref:hypothetical protein n=1 Tax=Paenibacillus macerans TaxID=44252 RepID=UPI003D31F39F